MAVCAAKRRAPTPDYPSTKRSLLITEFTWNDVKQNSMLLISTMDEFIREALAYGSPETDPPKFSREKREFRLVHLPQRRT